MVGGRLLKLWGEGTKLAKTRERLEAEGVLKTGRICAWVRQVAKCCRYKEHAILQTLQTPLTLPEFPTILLSTANCLKLDYMRV
jgi:hypothetical protein